MARNHIPLAAGLALLLALPLPARAADPAAVPPPPRQ